MQEGESRRFSRKKEDFVCKVCGSSVSGTGYTDHCPNCLWSLHVDINPGDRKSDCKGLMEPVKAEHDRNGFIISYICKKCKTRKRVRATSDDNSEELESLLKR